MEARMCATNPPFRTPVGDPHKIRVDLNNVHETLLLPLWGRAQAAHMRYPVLKDRRAVRLIEQLDYDFSGFRAGLGSWQILLFALRAKEFDAIVRDFIAEHPAATIVNIGAGLDTTFCRVDNGKIRWYDLDVPEVIRLRDKLLPQEGKARSIAKSMFDESFLNDIEAPQDEILFLLGGVLMYFDEEKVRSFLKMLSSRFPGAEAVFDSVSPLGRRVANRMVEKSGIQGAPMKWGIRNAREMERWGAGFRLLERYPIALKTRIFLSWGVSAWLLMRLNNLLSLVSINRFRLC